MAEPEQVPLDRVEPRLEAIVTGRDASTRTPCATDKGADDETAWLGRKRLARRPVPAATRNGAAR